MVWNCICHADADPYWPAAYSGNSIPHRNQEKINVKKFMGFSFLQMYRKPIILLSILIILELIAMLVIGSKFGLLLVLMVSAIQVIIFVKYMTHNEIKKVLIAFKGE